MVHCIPGQLCSRSGVLVLTGGLWDQTQSARQWWLLRGASEQQTVRQFSELDTTGVLSHLSSIGNWTEVTTGDLFVSICNYLANVNSYFHHNQTRPRTKNHKNTKWILYWINHRPVELTSILGNDKNLKEDLILRCYNYKIIFEIQSGELSQVVPSLDWVV